MRGKRTEREQNKSLWGSDMRLRSLGLQFSKQIIDPDFYIPADIRVREGAIAWVEGEEQDVPPKPPLADECLSQFCRLRDATDAEILDFAKRWGMLGVWPTRTSVLIKNSNPAEIYGYYLYTEPTQLWRDVAGRAWAILLVAAELSQNQRAFLEDWQRVVDFGGWNFQEEGFWQKEKGCPRPSTDSGKGGRMTWEVEKQRELLEHCIAEWLDQIHVRPKFFWQRSEEGGVSPGLGFDVNCETTAHDYGFNAKIARRVEKLIVDSPGTQENFRFDVRNPSHYGPHQLRPSRLFNVIVLQLVAAVMSPLFRCAICNKPFSVEDRRGRGRARGRHICSSPDCQAQAHLDNANAYNQRKTQTKHSAKSDQE